MVRQETSPEDVAGMAASAGILTARGGLASHAAVVARGWGIPAVVGATDVHPHDGTVEIAGRTFAAGDTISIDGTTGDIYGAAIQGTWEATPEAVTLLGWAKELGVDIGQAEPETAGPDGGLPVSEAGGEVASPGADDVTRALLIRGSVTAEQLAEALLATSRVGDRGARRGHGRAARRARRRRDQADGAGQARCGKAPRRRTRRASGRSDARPCSRSSTPWMDG